MSMPMQQQPMYMPQMPQMQPMQMQQQYMQPMPMQMQQMQPYDASQRRNTTQRKTKQMTAGGEQVNPSARITIRKLG
jgi:hypothetical protein